MIKIPNSVASELVRLIPLIIKSVPPNQSTRVVNAIRLLNKIVKQLNKIEKDE